MLNSLYQRLLPKEPDSTTFYGPHPLTSLWLPPSDKSLKSIVDSILTECPSLSPVILDKINKNNTDPTLDGLREIVFNVVKDIFEGLNQTDKNDVYKTIYFLAGSPDTPDLKWGENHCKDKQERFIQALYLSEKIDSSTKKILVYKNNERSITERSQPYTLDSRQSLDRGEISYVNGVATPLDQAKWDAYRLSDNVCQNKQIHGIYNPSHGYWKDLRNTPSIQSGTFYKVSSLLIKQWDTFFNRNPDTTRYLQICFSQGVAVVDAALKQLPEKMRKRICIIAIAPATFIPNESGCQAIHFAKKKDMVPMYFASNRKMISSNDGRVVIVPEDEDKIHPHDPHGIQYQKAIKPYIDNYIQHNSLMSDTDS